MEAGGNEDAPGVLVLLFAPAAPTVMSPEASVVPRDGIGPSPALADKDR